LASYKAGQWLQEANTTQVRSLTGPRCSHAKKTGDYKGRQSNQNISIDLQQNSVALGGGVLAPLLPNRWR
jgi:hypothetical protein